MTVGMSLLLAAAARADDLRDPAPNRDIHARTVWVHPSLGVTNGWVDSRLAEANYVIANSGGRGDVAAAVRLERNGPIVPFPFPFDDPKYLDVTDPNDLQALLSETTGQIKVVNSISGNAASACGDIGCTDYFTHVIVVAKKYFNPIFGVWDDVLGVAWAHEFGHSQGLVGHNQSDSENIMFASYGVGGLYKLDFDEAAVFHSNPTRSESRAIQRFDDIATSGAVLSLIDPYVSINDRGEVGFAATDAIGQGVYVGTDPQTYQRIGGSGASSTQGASINDASPASVAVRDRFNGPTYTVRNWPSNTVIGKSPGDFDSASFWIDQNDLGVVVLAGLINGSTDTELFAGSAQPPTRLKKFSGIQFIRPEIGNNNKIVVRDDVGQITVWQYPGGNQETVTTGYSFCGMHPGMDDDGNVIAFLGNRGNGDSVFLAINVAGVWIIAPIAGAEVPASGIAAIADSRIGVASLGDVATGALDVCTTFNATDANGKSGVFAVDSVVRSIAGVTFRSSGVARPVAALGDIVVAGKKLASASLFHPINNSWRSAFYAGFADGSTGVVRSRSLDDLLIHFTPAVVPFGGTSTLSVVRGEPLGLVALYLTAFNDIPFFVQAGVAVFDASGELTINSSPLNLSPFSASFIAIGESKSGRPELTVNVATLTVN